MRDWARIKGEGPRYGRRKRSVSGGVLSGPFNWELGTMAASNSGGREEVKRSLPGRDSSRHLF